MYVGAIAITGKTISRWLIRIGFLVCRGNDHLRPRQPAIRPGERGLIVPIAIIVFALLCMQVSMLPFRVLRWPRGDTVSAGIEITSANMNLALLLKASLFPERGSPEMAAIGMEVMFVVLFYAGAAFFLGLPLAPQLPAHGTPR